MSADAWPRDDAGNIRMVLYVAGPMTGFEDWNKPLFNEVTDELRRKGYHVLNPARQPLGLAYREYMHRGYKDIYRSDGLALLSGWEYSHGASLEHRLATKLGLECRPYDQWENITEGTPQNGNL